MLEKSLKNTILINAGAFLLVAMLEISGGWLFRDQFGSITEFYLWQLGYAVVIMAVIWVNHFILIPLLYDRRRYFLYGVFLVATIFLGAYLKVYDAPNWVGVSKMFFFLIYTTGTGMAAFFLRRNMIIRRDNEEKERLQKDMELNYLKEQVNPHFLFNSLNSIYSLSREQSPETPELVMQLSELMRYQLESSKKDAVLLKEELEFIENYLLLEEKRLSKRCKVEFAIEGNLRDLRIAPMLLIPFVENAIKHGAKSTNEQSRIDISASVEKSTLHFSVVNSKPSSAAASMREGLGLENVRRRLGLLYPDSHTLEISDGEKAYQVELSVNLGGAGSKG